MLREAHRGNTVDGDSQNGDEQMDKCYPVGKERPEEYRRTISDWGTDKNSNYLLQKENLISCFTYDRPCPQSVS